MRHLWVHRHRSHTTYTNRNHPALQQACVTQPFCSAQRYGHASTIGTVSVECMSLKMHLRENENLLVCSRVYLCSIEYRLCDVVHCTHIQINGILYIYNFHCDKGSRVTLLANNAAVLVFLFLYSHSTEPYKHTHSCSFIMYTL